MTDDTPKPASNNREEWKEYWRSVHPQNWFDTWGYWRTKPEISEERKEELKRCQSIKVDIANGIYQFKGVRLERADIEWLLATHENGVGPVFPEQHQRSGLDLRGADVSKADLSRLPLSRLIGGMRTEEYNQTTIEQRSQAESNFKGALLYQTHLECSELWRAHFEGAFLEETQLQRAILVRAHFEGADFAKANLSGADMRSCFFNSESSLRQAILNDKTNGCVLVADIRWGGVNLAVANWQPLRNNPNYIMLGDEQKASQKTFYPLWMSSRLTAFETAVRANLQMTEILQSQGVNSLANHFAYRGKFLQRQVYKRQGIRGWGAYIGSLIIDILAGYGYRPQRTLAIYLILILLYATTYFLIGYSEHLTISPAGSLILSIISFHGRGFFPQSINLDDPIMKVVASEAIVGLIVEISFIATFTQRFFGR